MERNLLWCKNWKENKWGWEGGGIKILINSGHLTGVLAMYSTNEQK